MPAPVGEPGGGMANAIVGTLLVVAIGAVFAIPIGIISGIYASEYAGTTLAEARPLRGRHAERRAVDRRSACSRTGSRCCRSGSSRRWPAASRSAS